MSAHQSSAVRSHLSLVCALAVDQQRQIDQLSNSLAAMSAATAAPDGSFLWRIAGFSAKAGQQVGLLYHTSSVTVRLLIQVKSSK